MEVPRSVPSVGVRISQAVDGWSKIFDDYSRLNEAMPRRAVEELNELWVEAGMMEQPCLVSGEGYYPQINGFDDDEEGDRDQPSEDGDLAEEEPVTIRPAEGRVTMNGVISRGFMLARMPDEEKIRMWAVFYMGTAETMPHPTMPQKNELLVFLDPTTMSVSSLDRLQEPFNLAAFDKRPVNPDALLRYPAALKELIQSPQFLRDRRDRQCIKIDQLLAAADREAAVRGNRVVLKAEHVYVPEHGDGTLDYKRVNTEGLLLGGVCFGLGLPGRELLMKRSIRPNGDLIQRLGSGMALGVEMGVGHNLPPGTELTPHTVFQVPLLGQDIHLEFREADQS